MLLACSSPPSSAPIDDGGSTDGLATDVADAASESESASDAGDTLAMSFVFVGCNRLQKADWDSVANPSSANVPELKQTFADIAKLSQVPRFFFFTGDLVLALKNDTTTLPGQLFAWAQLYKSDPLATKTDLVPMTGNHEMLYKDKNLGVELSNGPADNQWTSWLTSRGFDKHAGNGPTSAPPNNDALQDDQSKLSYSFDDGSVHFVVLNTDTWTSTPDKTTGSTQIGCIALDWIMNDLQAAQANAKVSSIFLFGHKPIVSPLGLTDSDSAINPALVTKLEALIDGTPKVKGYFCAHAHQWDSRRLPGSRGVYQIVAGNGGSQLESGWNVTTPYYGFTEARLYASGKVGVVSHQRPAPNPYTSTMVSPAVAQPELVIVP